MSRPGTLWVVWYCTLWVVLELYLENIKELDMIEDVHYALESSERFTSSLEVATI